MPAGHHILVAEDSGTVRDILTFLLESNDYCVSQAGDGIEAMQQILRRPPDLVLLDVDMPKMNGYQVCRLVKADSELKDIPVVMLTSRDRHLDRMWGMSTGADAYVIKAMDDEEEPFGELGKVIEECLDGRPPRPRPENAPPPVSEAEILDRLNGLLDQMLFRMSLRRKVGDLARSLQDMDETVRSIVSVIDQAAGMDAMVMLMSDSSGLCRLWTWSGTAPAAGAIDVLVDRAVAEAGNEGIEVDRDRMERKNLAGDDGQGGKGGASLATVTAFPLRARGSVLGYAVLGFAKRADALDPAVADTLELLFENAALVLDNAQLFAGLERSNRELQKTLDELTSTQDRLAKSERKVKQLEILIDQTKKERKVAEIVESEYFDKLKEKVKRLRGE